MPSARAARTIAATLSPMSACTVMPSTVTSATLRGVPVAGGGGQHPVQVGGVVVVAEQRAAGIVVHAQVHQVAGGGVCRIRPGPGVGVAVTVAVGGEALTVVGRGAGAGLERVLVESPAPA